MNLKNTSELKRKLIFEALSCWDKTKKNKKGGSYFAKAMTKLGWKMVGYHNSGSFKDCLVKKSIAVKYARDARLIESREEITREVEQYHTVSSKLKKYFPRIYGLDRGLLIQDKVMVDCYGDCDIEYLVEKHFGYRINDYEHNHGHSLAGTIKFFDWVYNRDDRWIYNSNIKLKDECGDRNDW